MQEDKVTTGSVINLSEVRIDPNTHDDTDEKLSTSINNRTPKINKNEPVYVNSDVDNTYLKVSIIKVHLSENGIRLSVKIVWNILKDDRQTEDWIGYYSLGLYIFVYF